jgi:hypothetical protein
LKKFEQNFPLNRAIARFMIGVKGTCPLALGVGRVAPRNLCHHSEHFTIFLMRFQISKSNGKKSLPFDLEIKRDKNFFEKVLDSTGWRVYSVFVSTRG